MSRALKYVCTTMCTLSLSCVMANETNTFQEIIPAETHESSATISEAPAQTTEPVVSQKAIEAPFKAFTGKVKAKKVRMRVNADIESRIVKELTKNDLLSIVGEKGEFFAVEPPEGLKAYVFRSFVLENIVEGNRVNVRLEPTLDAPVIGHLNSGDKINGVVCAVNNKWLEIDPPAQAKFYVAKDYVEYMGGPEVKAQFDKRKSSVVKLMDAATTLSKAELSKPFEEIDIDHVSQSFTHVINEYADFPEIVESAKEALAGMQESYVQKRISFLESKASAKVESPIAASTKEAKNVSLVEDASVLATDKMKLWEPIEEAIYLTWTQINEDKSMDQYYEDQKIAAVPIAGIVEPYNSPVKGKPGDFIVRDKDLPVAYVYSTLVNLQNLVGKKVTILGSARPNNNFAFPAYFVLSVE